MYDIRETPAKVYTVRKLADGNCWMTDNLTLPLTTGVTVEGSLNTSATPYSFTPTDCGSNGACPMNGNTLSLNGTYYYSWYAATAGTGTSSDVNIETPASICPVGWRLPPNYTISVNKSYGGLTNTYGYSTNGVNNTQNHNSQLESFPFSFIKSGRRYSNTTQSDAAYYYVSTAASGASWAYNFVYNTGNTGPQHYNNKYYGMSVRCVAL